MPMSNQNVKQKKNFNNKLMSNQNVKQKKNFRDKNTQRSLSLTVNVRATS